MVNMEKRLRNACREKLKDECFLGAFETSSLIAYGQKKGHDTRQLKGYIFNPACPMQKVLSVLKIEGKWPFLLSFILLFVKSFLIDL